MCEDNQITFQNADLAPDTMQDAAKPGPRRTVVRGHTEFTLVGTAHVSRASAEEVRELIGSGRFDAVAVELCPARHAALTRPDALAQMDLFQVIRQGKAGMVAANLALGAYQQRLAEQLGVQPGAEMRAAIAGAEENGLRLVPVDRDIGITLRRAYRGLAWWRRAGLLPAFLAGLLSRENISEQEVERLKQGDILEGMFSQFAEQSGTLHRVLIDERDRYMAAALEQMRLEHKPRQVLAVVGAGHLQGLAHNLETWGTSEPAAVRRELEQRPSGNRWLRWLPWLVVALILGGFVLGFTRSPELGQRMLWDWILINGGLSAAGAAIALAHPLTVIAAFVAAPLTSLNPLIGAGFVVAAVELCLRRPRVADFARLREDVAHLRGWWRNRVAHTLLVFLCATLGSAAGTYIAGFRILDRLVG